MNATTSNEAGPVKPKILSAVILSGILLLTSALPAVAAATPVWSTPADVSVPGSTAAQPQIVVAPDGSLNTVWGDGFKILTATSTDHGATWSTSTDVSGGGGPVSEPHLAFAADGTATAIWVRLLGSTWTLQASRLAPGGSWSPSVNLSTGTAVRPHIAVAPGGIVVVAWETAGRIQTSSFDGTWTVAQDISHTDAYSAQITATDERTFVAIWRLQLSSSESIIQTSSSTDGGVNWTTPASHSASGSYAVGPQITPFDGGLIAAWSIDVGSSRVIQVSSLLEGDTTWSMPTQVTSSDQYAADPQLVVASDGAVTIIWTNGFGSTETIQASTSRDIGATWSPPVDISTAGTIQNQQLVVAPDGTLTAVWVLISGSQWTVQATMSLDGGADWSEPVNLSASHATARASGPQLAVARNGSPVVVWSYNTGPAESARLHSSFPLVAPEITSGTPPTPTVGSVYTFQLTALGIPAPSFVVSSGALPTGLSLSATGLISGTPTAAGQFDFTVTVSNGAAPDATAAYSMTLTPLPVAPVITSAPPPVPTVGLAYSFQLTALGSPAPSFAVSSGALPPGMTLSATGLLSGTPTVAGDFSFTITALNGVASTTTSPDAAYSWTLEALAVDPEDGTGGGTITTEEGDRLPVTGAEVPLAVAVAGILSLALGAALVGASWWRRQSSVVRSSWKR